jgi:hypothetical protein
MKLLLWVVAIPVVWFAARLLFEVLDVAINLIGTAVEAAFNAADDRLQRVSAGAAQRVYKNQRRQAYQEYLKGSRAAAGVDERVVEAVKQGPQIRRLVFQKLPAAIKSCLCTHRLMAELSDTDHIFQIADEPECASVRSQVVDMAEAAVELLADYPFLIRDRDLLKASLLVRKRILPTCSDCPYLDFRLDQAPTLCPSARLAAITEQEVLSELDCNRTTGP